MENDEEKRRRRAEADNVQSILTDFASGLADDIVGDNTLVFGTNDEEALRRLREEQEQEERERTEMANQSAKDLIDSALQLYAKKTSGIDYVQLKSKADINTFTKILYQIEVNEEAIRFVMREIRNGDVNINLLKCLSDLQKTEIELWKIKSQYLTSMEASFKQITSDVEMDNAVEVDAEDEGEATGTAKIRSSRELMRLISEASANVAKEEVEENKKDAETNLF